VAISAGPRGAYRENVIVQAPVVGRRSAALRQEAWLAWSLLTPGLLVKMVGAPGRFGLTMALILDQPRSATGGL
jgi:hypothetical protein